MSAAIAARLRAAAEAAPDAPEGLELFRWFWAPVRWREMRLPIPRPFASVARYSPATEPPPPEVCIRPVRVLGTPNAGPIAGVGWDEGERVAVLFYAEGGAMPQAEWRPEAVSDQGMHALADTGDEIRWAEAYGDLLRLIGRLSWGDHA